MPAAIDTTDGVSSFASARVPAWHNLGTVFTDPITDFTKILTMARLAGWDVRRAPTFTLAADTGTALKADQVAIVRTNPVTGAAEVIGSTGPNYEPIQNEDSLRFAQLLLDGAEWETAGAIKGGRVVFGSLAHEREIVLDSQGVADKIKSYLLVYTSHDGSLNLSVAVTPVRVVCQNTLNLALSGVKQTFKIRHTVNAQSKIEESVGEARDVLGLANVYLDRFEVEAQALYSQAVTDAAFEKLIETVFPRPEKDAKGSFVKWENRRDGILLPYNAPQNAGIRGTGWGAFNALTDWQQWERETRGTNADENKAVAGMGLDGATNTFRNNARAAVLALV